MPDNVNDMNKVVAHVGFEVDNEASSLDKIVKQIEKINSVSKDLATSFSKFEDAFKKINSVVKDENGNIISTSQKTKTQLNEEARQVTANARAESKERIANANAESTERIQIAKRETDVRNSNNKKSLEILKADNKLTLIALNEEEKRRTTQINNELKKQLVDHKEALSQKKQSDKDYTTWWGTQLKQQEAYSKQSYSNMIKDAKSAYSQMSTAVNSLGGITNKNSSFDNAQTRNQLGYAVANATLTVTGVRAVLAEFANISSEVIEIEKNAINAQRIMGATNSDITNQLTQYAIETAKATDTQVTDVQEIQNAWIRINDEYGNNIDLLNRITDKTAKFINLGEIKDAEQAVNLLNAAILQFDMHMADGSVNIEEAEKTLDKWAYMADKTALGSADEFGESLSKIGGYITAMGGNIDDAIVLTSILGDRLAKSGDEAGNSLKTITAYLTRDKTINLFEKLGLDADGLNQSLMKTSTQFEEFDVIMNKVSKAYNDAMASGDEVTARAIQNAIGATRQGDSAIALLRNWAEDSQKYYGMIDEATSGSYLDEQNEALMQSFEAQWNSLKVSMVEFGNAFAKSGIIDGLSGIMGAFGNLLNLLSDLNPATLQTITTFTALSLAFAGFTKISKLTGVYDVFTTALKYGTVSQRENAEAIANATKEYLKNELAIKQTKIASDAYINASQAEKSVIDSGLTSLIAKNVEFEKLTLQYKNGLINAEQYTAAVKALNITEVAENVTTAQGTALDNASTVAKTGNTASTVAMTFATRAATVAQNIFNGVVAVGGAILKTLFSPITLVTVGITALIGVFSALKTKSEQATDSLQDSVEAFKESSSDLEKINEELATTASRLDELNGKENLSFVDEDEIKSLEAANEQLLIQKDLLEKANAEKAKGVLNQALNKYDKSYSDIPAQVRQYQSDASASNGLYNYALLGSDKNDIAGMIAYYQHLIQLKKEASDVDDIKSFDSAIDYTKQILTDSIKPLNDLSIAMGELSFEEGSKEFESQQKALADINSAIDLIYSNVDPEKLKQIKFENLFTVKKDVINELKELAIAGKLDEDTLYSNAKYYDIIKLTGMTAGQVIEKIKALVAEIKNIPNGEEEQNFNMFGTTDEVLDNYQKAMKSIQTALSGIDKVDTSSLIDLMQQFPSFDWGKFGITGDVNAETGAVGDYESALKALAKEQYELVNSTYEHSDAVESLYDNTVNATSSLTDWKDKLSEARGKLDSYNTLLGQMNDKEYKGLTSDMIDNVINKMPELVYYLNDENKLRQKIKENINEQKDASDSAYLKMIESSKTYYNDIKDKESEKLKKVNDTINEIINQNSQLVSALGEAYNVDLQNFGNIVQAKGKLEEDLIKSSAKAWAQYYKVQVNASTGLAEILNKNGGTANLPNSSWSDTDELRWMKTAEGKAAQQAADSAYAYNKAIAELNTLTSNVKVSVPDGVDVTSKGKVKSTKEKKKKDPFSEEMNIAEQSLKNLKNTVDKAQRVFDNAKGYDEQLKAIEKLTKAQEALRTGYKKTADMYKKQYDSIKGVDSYKALIESGKSFTVKEFSDEKTYNLAKQAQELFNNWKGSLNSIEDVTDSISKNYDNINTTLDKVSSDFEDLQGNIVKALKAQYKEQYDERVKQLKKENEEQVKVHNARIKQLQDEIDKINGNTPADKNKKLSNLKSQYGDWLADDSTLGMSKQHELQLQIDELTKEIKIDALEKQIDKEEELIDNLNDRLDEQLDSDSKFYDSMLRDFDIKMTDQRLYAEANALINSGNQKRIIELMTKYAPDYSGIATLMGQTAGQIIADQVANVMSGLKALQQSNNYGGYATGDFAIGQNNSSKSTGVGSGIIAGINAGTSGSTSKSTSTSTKTTTTPTKATTPTGNKATTTVKSGDTLWDLAEKYYSDGSKWTKIAKANSISDASKLKTGTKLVIPFFTGGETGNNEGLGYLHKKERVLDQQQTNAFDYLVYDFLPEVNDELTGSTVGKTDIVNNNNTFNKELVSVNVGTVVNNTPYDIKNSEDNLSRAMVKSLQKAGMNPNL